MNTQINPRTFTDQIPAYYEKTAFLKGLGRQDLADIHDYFFYKRLLLFYDQMEKSGRADKETYLNKITKVIIENQEHYDAAFGCPAADPRDGRKMRLFLKSPRRYSRRIHIEEQLIIPLKVKVKKMLHIGR
jgi:hypothetical protein